MSLIVEEIQAFLPLKIAIAETDEDGICLSGDGWRLRVNTNWRISVNDAATMSPSFSGDDMKAYGLDGLAGDELVEVQVQSRLVGLDLCFRTRAGRIFEIFSDFPYGEWIFSVWSPQDERQLPIFDLEGPIGPGVE
ncbi:hypothetical protein ACFYXS_37535 [Streptomyces sp. NPDC002574]|uniref:hypothetical protein n=1 Tax=Streptomyces sp. NPDC002574 TaxID=3364652 RepID=UPI003696A33F